MKKTIGIFSIIGLSTVLVSCANRNATNTSQDYIFEPKIVGDWWQIAGDPDLGEYTSPEQQPVDFGIWQAKDGSWQLWSCIRHTKCGGKTRLFYSWEGQDLSDTMWTPKGIAMLADTTLGETFGGLQAPHVILKDGLYHMLYGAWNQICLATSENGKEFTRYKNIEGQPFLFKESENNWINTRDAMTIKIEDSYYCYYVCHKPESDTSKIRAAIFCKTSKDLLHWSDSKIVSCGGRVAELDSWGGGDAECPFVVHMEDKFILFRNQEYGVNNINTEYCSDDPMDFGIDSDQFEVGQLAIAAPEIIKQNDQYYIIALLPSLKGIRMAKLEFEKVLLH